MKPNPTFAASSTAGTRLRMTARSILDHFPASRNAPRQSLSRRTGRWRLTGHWRLKSQRSRTETRLYRHPTLRAASGGLTKTAPLKDKCHDGNHNCCQQSQDYGARRLLVWHAGLRDSEIRDAKIRPAE